MQVVFDCPVASRSVGEDSGRERAGRDIGSPFGFDLVAALDPALDHGDSADFREARGTRIGTLRIDPVDHMGDRMGTNLNAAVLLADGLDPFDLVGWRRFEIALDIGMERRLVVFHRQKIIGLGVHDRLGDVGIASDGID